jgi:peroxiredoxin
MEIPPPRELRFRLLPCEEGRRHSAKQRRFQAQAQIGLELAIGSVLNRADGWQHGMSFAWINHPIASYSAPAGCAAPISGGTPTVLRWFYLLLIVGWCGIAWVTYGGCGQSTAPTANPRAPSAEKHYVTPRQLAASGAWQDRPVAPFSAWGHDGKPYDGQSLGDQSPTVLVFIKKDCPCSVEFESFFHRLERCYRGQVRFFGVLDGSVADARRYAEANRVPYPVLADPDRAIITRFKAENGGYVTLLKPGGVVDTLWPGCSAEMMTELGRKISALAGAEERPVDVSGMPSVLTTGCPFEP